MSTEIFEAIRKETDELQAKLRPFIEQCVTIKTKRDQCSIQNISTSECDKLLAETMKLIEQIITEKKP